MVRSRGSKGSGTPAWVVTFADLMALLLTFFIMLLSFSTMDTQKYKAVVKSMEEAFGAGTGEGLPILLGDKQHRTGGAPIDIGAQMLERIQQVHTSKNQVASKNVQLQKAKTLLHTELKKGTVQIETQGNNLLIRFPERVSFPSGSANLSPQFKPVINKLRQALLEIPGKVTISGYSDDQPINTFRYRSNWELSAARAVSVLHAIIVKGGIDTSRFVVEGRADTHPLKDNSSAENRAENRRVEILISDGNPQGQ